MADFKSIGNLKLAWIRTLSGENADYRNLQRIEIDSFGWAEDDNLSHLHKELNENSYNPSPATKIYIPKPSGLLRPITVLRIRDTIVYQAIANAIAEKARRHLSKYYFKSVFSSILTSTGYPYFYSKWRFGRNKLDLARKQAFSQGYEWIAELDIASFYDIIDHKLLRSILTKFYNNEECLQLLLSCLSEWTAHPMGLGLRHSHGIPQGPLPSSFLAECVMHLLDRRLTRLSNSLYFRYVDDITLLSKNENDAKNLFSRIEIFCRELGLVPQVKRHVQKLKDIEDLMFPEPSPIQASPYYPAKVSKRQNDLARKKFLSCFRRGGINRTEEQLIGKLNYSLFRMNPDRRILKKVLGLLYALPNIADAVNFYLRKFADDAYIRNYIFNYLNSKSIYDYVNARCLETIYICCARGHFGKLSKTCVNFSSKPYHTISRVMAVTILGLRRIETRTLFRMINRNDDIYLQEHLLFALCNSVPDTQKQALLNQFVRTSDPHLALISAYLLTSNNLKLEGLISNIHPWATPILVSKGLTKKRVIGDRIGEILQKRYEIILPAGFSFRSVFNKRQYKAALYHINMAEGGYATNRSLWATQMDNFNQIILTLLFNKLGLSVRRGDEFRSLTSSLLRMQFPNVAAVFERCHNARLINPVPHAYSIRLGTFSRDIKPTERNKLRKELKIAYQEFIDKY